MAGRAASVLNVLKSSPKGQLSYDGKMKTENILNCLIHVSVHRVVEEHCPGRSEEEVTDPGTLGFDGEERRGRAREDPGTPMKSVPSTAGVEQERRSSKEGEEAVHSCR